MIIINIGATTAIMLPRLGTVSNKRKTLQKSSSLELGRCLQRIDQADDGDRMLPMFVADTWIICG
jgi:hypothetical protein